MSNYKNLENLFKRLSHLGHLGAIARWDMAVMMPSGGSHSRSEALSELSVIFTEYLQNPEVGEWIEEAQNESNLSDWQRANLKEMSRHYRHATAVAKDLVAAKSLAGSKCEHAWRSLRAENNWKDFLPLFQEVLNLSREEAQQRAAASGLSLYDSLVDLYDPGMRSEQIAVTFDRLKSFLPGFIDEVIEVQKANGMIPLQGYVPLDKQKKIGFELMKALQFDFHHGRLDESHHPFCGGVPSDVRMTTRYSETQFEESLMGVIHETGHASYEQGLPQEWISQPVGEARGMGLHESQSLLFEMQVARGVEFSHYLSQVFTEADIEVWSEKALTPENIFKFNTQVEKGLIRTSADEVTYPAHIILRFEIEKALIEGSLEAKDLPEIWSANMQKYLGLNTDGNFKDGCMQDIHWTDGSFGYFPSYTLGAINAAQIFRKLLQDKPEVRDELRKGQFSGLKSWLKTHIWSKGSFYSTDELLLNATGEKMNVNHFINHLQHRYLN